MPGSNTLIHAVAGGRKTQRVVDTCVSADPGTRTLVLTYTAANQDEIRSRLAQKPGGTNVEVLGWFQFLIRHWVRPYVPFLYEGRRVRGFNFKGEPGRFAKGETRYFDSSSSAYRRTISKLAHETEAKSGGALISWLERSYDSIIIDEVQDLNGWDLEILLCLLNSQIPILMVGDTRQAILATNPQDPKNKQYLFSAVIDWFRAQEAKTLLSITEEHTTWRCHPHVAVFADSLFGATSGFAATTSENTTTTDHDGVYLVHPDHLDAYVAAFSPQALRWDNRFGTEYALDCVNFGEAKGATHRRVLIVPTKGFEEFVRTGKALGRATACKFYVGVTRAQQSAAIITSDPGQSALPVWTPTAP